MCCSTDENETNQSVAGADGGNAAASRKRLTCMRAAMDDCGTEAFLIRDTSNLAWLTAFDNVFDFESAHAAFIDAQQSLFHTDSRYLVTCKLAAAGGPWIIEEGPADHTTTVSHARWALEHLGGNASMGIEQSISLAEYRGLCKEMEAAGKHPHIVETDGMVKELRGVKDAGEIARMRAAQAITDAAFSHIIEYIKPGFTERDVQLELEEFMMRHGAEGLAFGSIVAFGENGARPHAIPGDTRLEAGHCMVMDFGARAQGYCSDMTRTVFIGQPDARLSDAFAVLRHTNETVEHTIKPGLSGADMHQLAEDILAEGGFGGKMGHGLGHGVGIDIHELPLLSPRNEEPLVPGNVVTVEPGIYIEGDFGMRLEDFGVVTENGFDVFTKSTHDMVIL